MQHGISLIPCRLLTTRRLTLLANEAVHSSDRLGGQSDTFGMEPIVTNITGDVAKLRVVRLSANAVEVVMLSPENTLAVFLKLPRRASTFRDKGESVSRKVLEEACVAYLADDALEV